jgi:hypothetical protein
MNGWNLPSLACRAQRGMEDDRAARGSRHHPCSESVVSDGEEWSGCSAGSRQIAPSICLARLTRRCAQD